MTTTDTRKDGLRDHFLIASPYLEDPRFQGTVIYICEHSDEGALGLVLNRPLKVPLGDILGQLDLDGSELDIPVMGGGPVQPERGFVLHNPGSRWQHSVSISEQVALTTSRDILEAIGLGQGPETYLVALGYSGWGEGQLEDELSSNSWLVCRADPDVLFITEWQQRYAAVLDSMGIDLTRLSQTVGHA